MIHDMDRLDVTFIGVFIIIFIGFSMALCLKDALFSDVFGGASIGLGTALLAYFTARLAQATINEGKMERRRLRIKEKLEGFYSPLVHEIENIERIKQCTVYDMKNNLQSQFKEFTPVIAFLASENLKEKIAKLYKKDFELSSADWNRYIDKITEIIREDFSSLIEEYNELTKK